MNKLIIEVVLFLTVSLPGSGQKIIPSPADLYTDALEYFFAGDYSEALPVLLTLQEKGHASANISYKIGECYLNMQGQKTKAIPYLKEAVQKISATYSGNSLEEEFAPATSLLYLGIAYRLNNDFNNALACFNNYLNSIDDVDKENKALAEYHIQRCNYAHELMASPARFTADTLSDNINTPESNFSPLVTSDEKVLYYMNQLKFYDAVMHTVKIDSAWQTPENLTPEIKSDGDHYITGMSADGTRLFLTSYDPYRSGEIYTTEFKNGRWSEMLRLNDKINTLFNETHASLSPDGQYLYFTSDRKGGYGGLDIYRSSLTQAGEWGPPVNLGPLINSPYNEESPFVSSDSKKLFFSSQGHYNMGGYDVFASSLDTDGNWLPPVNIGYPLNTTDDDLFFFPLDSGNIAYQSRFSVSTARQDILRFKISSFGNPSRFSIIGKVNLQADPGYDPGNISIAFIDRNASDTLAVRQLQNDGSFRQKLPGGTYRLDFSDETGSLLSKELDIPEYFPSNELVLNAEITVRKKLTADTLCIKDIRFAFDKSLLDDQYRVYLDEIMKFMVKYPGLTLQINGYADSRGKESYNLRLSLFRARTVEDYLKSKAAFAERISVNAFGEKNPVAVNVNINGTDNPHGRSYNRRVELVFTNTPGELTVIRYKDIPENLLYK
jgi:outer membrane protein OmpA-like peptidoglycan-associated protein